MATSAVIAVLVIFVFAALVIMPVVLHRREKKLHPKALLDEEAYPVISKNATLVAKEVEKQKIGSDLTPSHYLVYTAEFDIGEKENILLAVWEKDYDALREGQSGVLVYQNTTMLGFG